MLFRCCVAVLSSYGILLLAVCGCTSTSHAGLQDSDWVAMANQILDDMKACKVSNDGVGIEYLVWRQEEQNSRHGVVLIPGMICSSRYWTGCPELLAKFVVDPATRRTTIAISLRGRGGSDCPEDGWTINDHVSDIKAVFDAQKLEKCHLLAHSIGVIYALAFAVQYPERVLSLTLGDYPPVYRSPGEDWAQRISVLEGKDCADAFPQRICAARETRNFSEELAGIHVPMMLLRGTEGDALLKEALVKLYRAAPSLKVFALSCGHDVFLSADATSPVLEFLTTAELP